MQTKANGTSINYQIDGGAGPWLMLSNSLATDLSMWDAQARELSGVFRVLRYDQRGHGKTDAPAERYTFEILIADALALMDALGIAKANFAGLSMEEIAQTLEVSPVTVRRDLRMAEAWLHNQMRNE